MYTRCLRWQSLVNFTNYRYLFGKATNYVIKTFMDYRKSLQTSTYKNDVRLYKSSSKYTKEFADKFIEEVNIVIRYCSFS